MCTYLAKGINVSCRTINKEAFIFDQKSRQLLKLDMIGSFIWDQIRGEITIDQVVEICCQAFEGSRQEIASSINEFLNDLCDKKVLNLSSEPFCEEVTSVC